MQGGITGGCYSVLGGCEAVVVSSQELVELANDVGVVAKCCEVPVACLGDCTASWKLQFVDCRDDV